MQESAATRIHALRQARGIQVKDFVKSLGISKQTYYDRLNGASWPDEQLELAAKLLETSPQVLRYGPESVFTPENQVALEKIVQLLLAALDEKGAAADIDLVARMTTHLYGIYARGGKVDQATVDSLLRLAI